MDQSPFRVAAVGPKVTSTHYFRGLAFLCLILASLGLYIRLRYVSDPHPVRSTLHCQVDHALGLLTKYNDRLQQELKDRRRVKKMIADYLAAQKDLETQAEERLEQYRDKLEKVNSVRDDLKSHIQVNSSFGTFNFISSLYRTSSLPTVSPRPHEATRRHRGPGAIAICWRSLH